MKLWLHHINFCSTNVPAMDEFYRSVLGMAPEPSLQASRDILEFLHALAQNW